MKKALSLYAIALGLRLVPVSLALRNQRLVFLDGFDSGQYHHLAVNLLKMGEFTAYPTSHFFAYHHPYQLEAFRLPGYPLFLAAVYSLAQWPWLAALAQALITALGAPLLFLLGTTLFGRSKPALLGALLYAVEPLLVTMNAYLFADALFGFLIAAFLLVHWNYLRGSAEWSGALEGTVAGLISWVKPWPAFLFPLLFLVKPKLRKTALAFAAYLALVGGWAFRNYSVYEVPSLTALAGYNLYVFNRGALLVKENPWNTYISIMDTLRKQAPENPLRRAQCLGALGLKDILGNLREYVKAHVALSYPLFVESSYNSAVYGEPRPRTGILSGFLLGKRKICALKELLRALARYPTTAYELGATAFGVLLLFLGLLGLFKLPKFDRAFGLSAALMLAYFLATPGPAAQSRFRTAWAPVACAAAGALLARKEPTPPLP